LRDISALWPTIAAPIGSLRDKLKIFTLTRKLAAKSITDIFSTKEQSTMSYLKAYGFSDKIINTFFKPFFTGIFLEEELKTSSRLFEFIFKMFGEGYAAIPHGGIGAIATQLKDALHQSNFKFHTKVKAVTSTEIVLENGESLPSDKTIITLPRDSTTGAIADNKPEWKSCDNLYFTVDKRSFKEGIIGLIPNERSYCNNLYYPFGQSLNGDPILSVTVVKTHRFSETELVNVVQEELLSHCGITTKSFLRNYHIKRALPHITNAAISLENAKVAPNIFVAGDYLLSGSLNAAMASGEAAANAVISELQAR
jgi:protoporphyrinogen oxidase